jgi:hypothetical protein
VNWRKSTRVKRRFGSDLEYGWDFVLLPAPLTKMAQASEPSPLASDSRGELGTPFGTTPQVDRVGPALGAPADVLTAASESSRRRGYPNRAEANRQMAACDHKLCFASAACNAA